MMKLTGQICTLVFINGFHIIGRVVGVTEHYITLENPYILLVKGNLNQTSIQVALVKFSKPFFETKKALFQRQHIFYIAKEDEIPKEYIDRYNAATLGIITSAEPTIPPTNKPL